MSLGKVFGWGCLAAIGSVVLFNQLFAPSIAANLQAEFERTEQQPKPVVLTPEQHKFATGDHSDNKPKTKAEPERIKMSDLPPMDNADHMIGAAINMNGYLCARPIEVREAGGGLYGVRCITRRDGTGISDYLVNPRTNEVEPI